MPTLLRDVVDAFRDAEKSADLAVGSCVRSLNSAMRRAEDSDLGPAEKYYFLQSELKHGLVGELDDLKSHLKKSMTACKNEVSSFNRYVLAFIKMNVDANNPGLDILLGTSSVISTAKNYASKASNAGEK